MTLDIFIDQTGEVQCIHSDQAMDMLKPLGPATVTRSGEIEFDNALGCWCARIPVTAEHAIVERFERREQALNYEQYAVTVLLSHNIKEVTRGGQIGIAISPSEEMATHAPVGHDFFI